MTKAIIIDDEEPARRTLGNYISKYCPKINVIGEADGVATAKEQIAALSPDLLFLDIHMKDGTGFQLLEDIDYSNLIVIFVTAYDEYALKAFNYNAIHYLVKPLDPLELVEAVNKIEQFSKTLHQIPLDGLVNYVSKEERKNLVLCSMGEMHIVPIDSIVRLKADGPYTEFHLNDNRQITVSKTIKEYHDALPTSKFYRCHNSHIINLGEIKVVRSKDGLVEMNNGDEVSLSRSRKDGLMEALN